MITRELLLSAAQLKAHALPENWTASSVSTDTRHLTPGALFVALRGPTFDGHTFCSEALGRGAAAVVVDEQGFAEHRPDGPYVIVPDTLSALQALALAYRKTLRATVLAVTGSNGKTSTKEMLAGMLSDYRLAYTAGNLNNHIGVPLTLLALPADCEVAVIEMGMNHAGEIALLSRLACPDHAIITSVAAAHAEFFDAVQDIARAKLEITEGMAPGSWLCFQATSPGRQEAEELARLRGLQLCLYEMTESSAVREAVRSERAVQGRFLSAGPHGLCFEWDGQTFENPSYFSATMAENLLGAALLLLKSGLASRESLLERISRARPLSAGRFQVFRRADRILIDDTYNANPASFHRALLDLRALMPQGKLALVAGEMAELGDLAESAHQELTAAAREIGFAFFALCGRHYRPQMLAGLNLLPGPFGLIEADDSRELAQKVLPQILECDGILVKGSRSSRMEIVSQAIKDQGYV